MFHLFRVKVHLLFQILAALTRDIQTSQKHSASEELRVPVNFLRSQGLECAAHPPVCGVGHED